MAETTMSEKPEIKDGQRVLVAVAWILVGIPLAWGVYQTLKGAMALFR